MDDFETDWAAATSGNLMSNEWLNETLDSFMDGGYTAVETWSGYSSDAAQSAAQSRNASESRAVAADLGGSGGGLLDTVLNGANSAVKFINDNDKAIKLIGGVAGGMYQDYKADQKAKQTKEDAEAERQRINDSVKGLKSPFKSKPSVPTLTRKDGTPLITKGRYQ